MLYPWLTDQIAFPSVSRAKSSGILALGGDLSTERLILAYNSGIFPWFSEGDPIIWWSPKERFVLFPEKIYVSKTMKQILKRKTFTITFDKDFETIIRNCQQTPREGQDGTWITSEMMEAYIELHKLGHAHSVEVWQDDKIVGGLYGMVVGGVFCGESMFAHVSNASKAGFITLVKTLQSYGIVLIDCQTRTNHLESLGGEMIPRNDFIKILEEQKDKKILPNDWGELEIKN